RIQRHPLCFAVIAGNGRGCDNRRHGRACRPRRASSTGEPSFVPAAPLERPPRSAAHDAPVQPDPARRAPTRLPRGLSSFRHRDYRLFWFAQLVSLTGTWLQSLAQSWLVLTLTNSPLQLGLIGVFQFGPSLLL